MLISNGGTKKKDAKRFDAEVLQPFLSSTASKLAIGEGKVSAQHALEYLIKAEGFEQERRSARASPVPPEIITILELQCSNGQWKPSKRLKEALGQTIPDPPLGVSDWRWTTSLAVIYLRWRPDLIDHTLEAHRKAMSWVDDTLLAEAHLRLPPPGIYFPMDAEAVKMGRWQAQVAEALENYGHTYFLPNSDEKTVLPNQNDIGDTTTGVRSAGVSTLHGKQAMPSEGRIVSDTSRVRESTWHRATRSSYSKPRALPHPSRSKDLLLKKMAARQALEGQSQGLRVEFKQAFHAARGNFRVGDHVETSWRPPARFNRPRVDLCTWHPGRVIGIHESEAQVDLIFTDGNTEQCVRGVPVRLVRPDASQSPSCLEPSVGESSIGTKTKEDLSLETRHGLIHIATMTNMIRRSWRVPVTMSKELTRLARLRQKRRSKIEWRVSASPINIDKPRQRRSSVESTPSSEQVYHQRRRPYKGDTPRLVRNREQTHSSQPPSSSRQSASSRQPQGPNCNHAPDYSRPQLESTPALAVAQSNLVASAVAYDRCVAAVRDCITRGVTAFHAARTHSEQQKAFEETTASLGPAQPAPPGYTDWRDQPVTGLQSATLRVVEAMEAWANESLRARNGRHKRGGHGDNIPANAAHVPRTPTKPSPFFWGGKPIILTILSHTEDLVGNTPELKQWYGPGFPLQCNPFCLAYPITQRPPTPTEASVQSYVAGKMVCTVSSTLLQQRRAEEADLEATLQKQASAPSWWPATRGVMSEKHYCRLRQAEKRVLREMKLVAATGCFGGNDFDRPGKQLPLADGGRDSTNREVSGDPA